MSEWQPIETAPADTEILTFADWSTRKVGVSSFKWVQCLRQEIKSESTNKTGRRVVIQEYDEQTKEWNGEHWEPTHWMPLPPPPSL